MTDGAIGDLFALAGGRASVRAGEDDDGNDDGGDEDDFASRLVAAGEAAG